jgi:hypothetical protein
MGYQNPRNESAETKVMSDDIRARCRDGNFI